MDILQTLKIAIIYRLERLKGIVERYTKIQPKVYDTKSTLTLVKDNRLSIARFGDGEFNLIQGNRIGFQLADEELANELKKILVNENSKLLVCIPDVFGSLRELRKKPRHFWQAYLGRNRNNIYNLIDLNKQYGNSLITRFQTGYSNPEHAPEVIALFKEIWDNQDVVFIEGEKTRLGVGNDLFSNVNSIKRVLVPATNAYEKKSEIIEWISNNICKENLIILACGPTATVLSQSLCKRGYWALDLGHIDIQYEYYIRGITGKSAISGKYVNESSQIDISEINDNEYNDSVIRSFV